MHAALNSSERMDWQTPDSVLELVRKVGVIALDPCTVPSNPTGALEIICERGLESVWFTDGDGLVYVNPPYGRELPRWVDKTIASSADGCACILLVPARTDTRWYDAAKSAASALCEVRGRLVFRGAPASAPFPSAVFYFGPQPFLFCHVFQSLGRVQVLR